MEVYIIIICYNGLKWLPNTLESTKQYPVIVVDNASTDGSIEFIKNHYPDIQVIDNQKNIGFGQANNLGISRALQLGADYVLLLNQDARIQKPVTLEILVEKAEKNKDFGIISPLHLNKEGDELEYVFSNYIKTKNELLTDLLLDRPRKDLYQYRMINAAAWLISRSTLLKVGGFHPMFFLYGEDDNYCQRVLYHGLKIGVCPEAKIYHDSGFDYHSEKEIGSEEYYKRFINQVKVKYGNVHLDNEQEFRSFKSSLLKKSLISLSKLNLKESQNFFTKWRMIRNLELEATKIECRKENSTFLFNS